MLYRYEVKGIQSFVLRSSRLQDIAAASALVAGGLDDARERLLTRCGGELLISAAGSATMSFPNAESASRFAELWPLVVGELLPGPSMIAGLAPDLDSLRVALQQSRNSPDAPAYDAGPLVARAGRTGAPAVARRGGVLQDAVHERLQGRHGDRGFEALLLSEGALSGRVFSTDAEHLGRGGYVALVHADGNGIGKRVVELLNERGRDYADVLRRFRRFSEVLAEVTVAAVREAMEACFNEESARELPVRPIVVGGDDVTVLIHPRYAVVFTEAYLQAFENGCNAHPTLLKGVTASAGVVFAKKKAPTFAVHDICEALCGWVKSQTNREVSALGMFRVSASPMEPFEESMERSLSLVGGAEPVFLGGPYTLDDSVGWPKVADLQSLVSAAGQLPRGGLRSWLEVYQEDPRRGAVRWERLAEVCRGDGRFVSPWERLSGHLEGGCWRDPAFLAVVRRRSPVLDVLNLSHLLSIGGGGQ